MRRLLSVLFLFPLVALASSVDVTFYFSDFTARTTSVHQIILTPLAAGADYAGAQLSAAPRYYTRDTTPTLTNGYGTLSNLLAGYAYRVQFLDGYSAPSVTNYFPEGLTGPVNGNDYKTTLYQMSPAGGRIVRVWYASGATNSGGVVVASNVVYAATAGLATNALYAAQATNAAYATRALYATNGLWAAQATNATHASYAAYATNAFHATNADLAVYATNAEYANLANYASAAGTANTATAADAAQAANTAFTAQVALSWGTAGAGDGVLGPETYGATNAYLVADGLGGVSWTNSGAWLTNIPASAIVGLSTNGSTVAAGTNVIVVTNGNIYTVSATASGGSVPAGVVTNGQSGVTLTNGTFSGTFGSAAVGSGTNLLTVTNAATGDDLSLSYDESNNLVWQEGGVIAKNPNSTFTGNGRGLTNLVLASGVSLTNANAYGLTNWGSTGQTNYTTTSAAGWLQTNTSAGTFTRIQMGNVVTSGTFTGNGSGLTNLPTSGGSTTNVIASTLYYNTLTVTPTTTLTVDLSTNTMQVSGIYLTNNIALNLTNASAGKSVNVLLYGSPSAQYNVILPSGTRLYSGAITNAVTTNKSCIVSFTAFGTANSNVVSTVAIEP